MAGRPEFWSPSEIAAVTAEDYQMASGASGTVPSGGLVSFSFSASAGYVVEVMAIELFAVAPAGAATGTHEFEVKHDGLFNGTIRMVSNYGDACIFSGVAAAVATSSQRPSTEVAQAMAVQSLGFDEADGITVIYKNLTDVSQVTSVKVKVWGRWKRVAV